MINYLAFVAGIMFTKVSMLACQFGFIVWQICVHIFVSILQIAVELFHWISKNFDLLVARDEKSGEHRSNYKNVCTKLTICLIVVKRFH